MSGVANINYRKIIDMTFADPLQGAVDTPRDCATQQTQEQRDTAVAVRIIVTVMALLLAWGVSFATWGLPGLYLPAVGLVPVIWGVLLLITRG